MAMRYYRKFTPETPVTLSTGQIVRFKSFDGVRGWYATEDPVLHQEFEQAQIQNKFGLSEVAWAEYDAEYLKKKGTLPPLNLPWREEMRGSKLIQEATPVAVMGSAAVVAIVGVRSDQSAARMVDPAPVCAPSAAACPPVIPVSTPPPATKEEFKPTIGRRIRKTPKPA